MAIPGPNKNYYLYHLVDSQTGAIKYVGVGKNNRMKMPVCYALNGNDLKNPKKYRWIKKMLANNIPILHEKVIENLSLEEAFELEKREIREIGFKQLTNLKDGGRGGHGPHSLVSRKRMAESSKKRFEISPGTFTGLHHSEETRKKISESAKKRFENTPGTFKGRYHSEEAKRKMSESHKGCIAWNIGIPRTEEVKRKTSEKLQSRYREGSIVHPCKGKHLSEETKKKISDSEKGKFISLETRKKMSFSQRGREHSEETKKKISLSKQIYWQAKRKEVYVNG